MNNLVVCWVFLLQFHIITIREGHLEHTGCCLVTDESSFV